MILNDKYEMTPQDKQACLDSFLTINGITAQFNLNLRRRGRPGVIDTHSLIKWLKLNNMSFKLAIYLAFFWGDCPEHKEDPEYWNKMSFRWSRYLKKINY